MLPSELWLRIFEIAARWDPLHVDIEFLREDKRNRVLLALAYTCRQWLPLALHILYREIFLSGWDYHDEEGRYCAGTRLPMKRLVSTLSLLTARRSALPRTVQVLHVAIGRYQYPSSSYDYCLHCDFVSVAEAVSLCPAMRHLSLRVHCEPTGHTWSIPPAAIRIFTKADNIEQLTYSDQQDTQVLDRLRTIAAMRAAAASGSDFATYAVSPSLKPLFQLVSVSRGLRYLEVETSDADGSGGLSALSHANLEEFRLRMKGRQHPAPTPLHHLLDGAPALSAVVLSDAGPGQVYALPRRIKSLLLRGPEVALDLRDFHSLTHLGIEFPIYEEIHKSPALDTFARLPESLTHLTLYGEHNEHNLPVTAYSPRDDFSMQELLRSEIFRAHVQRLSHVQQWTIVVDPDVSLRVPDALSKPSRAANRLSLHVVQMASRPWEKVKRPMPRHVS
ncbi:hypothetical protein EXIGLDRAFT_692168 [Exidia glandulosa HHB12029]|uniref:F-box domain-containing protein n=1 Tax=Exidia glandulosa HHB12029 TaxID=1314781 RepID=A0A165I5H2_EXIGL|nr:hypothetical protein EXIGLDRAFT_692168 [Exidia glandulosa HHB12029]